VVVKFDSTASQQKFYRVALLPAAGSAASPSVRLPQASVPVLILHTNGLLAPPKPLTARHSRQIGAVAFTELEAWLLDQAEPSPRP
jgi:hypothetical protein